MEYLNLTEALEALKGLKYHDSFKCEQDYYNNAYMEGQVDAIEEIIELIKINNRGKYTKIIKAYNKLLDRGFKGL